MNFYHWPYLKCEVRFLLYTNIIPLKFVKIIELISVTRNEKLKQSKVELENGEKMKNIRTDTYGFKNVQRNFSNELS